MIEVKEMIANGFAIKKIAEKLHLPEVAVKQIIADNQLSLVKETFSEQHIVTIIQLYQEGVSIKALAEKFSIDKRRIIKWLTEHQITIRTSSQAIRTTNFQESYFDIIDDANKAYWLGFCYADAYNCDTNNTFILTLKGEDYSHLVKLAELLHLPSSKIKTSNLSVNHKIYPIASLKLYSKHICQQMSSLGCPRAKSFTITFPTWLRKELQVDFIRGLFDGDGSLCKRKLNNEWKWSLTTTQECGEVIKNIIMEELGLTLTLYNISETGNNTFNLEASGNKKVLTLAHWLYSPSSDSNRLTRKYDKYLELKKQQLSRTFSRDSYRVSQTSINNIIKDLEFLTIMDISHKYRLHPRTILKIQRKYGAAMKIADKKLSVI
jgi:hypothetical protein